MPTSSAAASHYEFKSAFMSVVAFLPHSTDLQAITHALEQQVANDGSFFDNDAVLIDLSLVRDSADSFDFIQLAQLLRTHKMLPIAVRGGNEAQMADAQAAGFAIAPEEPAMHMQAAPKKAAQPAKRQVDVVHEVSAPSSTTVVIRKPLRSGQQIYARGADLIVLDVVSFGAEVIADGHIHVYAPLRGRAIAGARGNTEARIFSTCLEPQLLSIAGIYRTSETPLSAEVQGKAAQVFLDGEKMHIQPL